MIEFLLRKRTEDTDLAYLYKGFSIKNNNSLQKFLDLQINSSTPTNDQHRISPYNIKAIPSRQVMRVISIS